MRSKKSGVTLIEVLLSSAIIAGLATMAVPVSLSQINSYNLESTRDALVSFLSQAQTSALANSSTSPKGVFFGGTSLTAFSGASYATRDPSLDTVYPVPASVTFAGPSEVVFSQLQAQTSAATYTLNDSTGLKTVTVNAEGLIDW